MSACRLNLPITKAELTAAWANRVLCYDCKRQLVELVVAHDVNPDLTAAVGYEVLDCPLLRFTVYVTDPDTGNILAEPDPGPLEVRPKTRQLEVALKTPLPGWWRPGVSEA